MFGIKLIITLAIMGGIIAFIGDKLGFKLAKKRLSFLGLRPRNTSTLIAVLSGVLTASFTLGILSLASVDVRTALFGMDKLKSEIQYLNSDLEEKNSELLNIKELLVKSYEEISNAESEKEQAKGALVAVELEKNQAYKELAYYQKESADLEKLKNNLQQEIVLLEKEANRLEEGVIKLREGQVLFRAGQVVYAGVLSAGENETDTIKSVSAFLEFANKSLVERLNIENKDTQLILVGQNDLQRTVSMLMAHEGSMVVRLLSAGNTLVGEPIFTEFALYPNNLIYKKNEVIYTEKISDKVDKRAAEAILISYLSRLNAKVVKDGLLPDPTTGNVGNLEIPYMMSIVERIHNTSGNFTITSRATRDIYSLGPLDITIKVENI